MQSRNIFADIGKTISPTTVRDYAKSRGWIPVEGSQRRLWIYRHSDAELRQLIIPIDKDAAWVEALYEVILRLADFEQQGPEFVLNNLQTAYSDVVRFRVGGEDVKAGMLPLTDATSLIDGVKKAFLASACSVVNKVVHHQRMSLAAPEELLRVCKLGQTEIGSYVVKVVCPLTEMEDPSLFNEIQPFARETTSLLMKGCQKIVQGIESDQVVQMLEKDSSQPEVSSNLCDALLQMHAARDNADLSIEMSWAAIPKYSTKDIPTQVKFKPEYFRGVDEIRRYLRPQKEQKEMLLLGTVETLNGDVGDDGRRSGEVDFALFLPDEDDVVRARGNLGADDYAKAVRAHESGRNYISFRGILKRGMRIGRVEQIKEFKELDPPSDS